MKAIENPFPIKKLMPHYMCEPGSDKNTGRAAKYVPHEEIVDKLNEIIEALNSINIGILK